MQFAFVANELKEEQAQDRSPACRSVRRKGLNILAAAVLATLTSTATLAADDISGVAIGTSLAAAKEAIAKANPDYQINPLMLTSGKEAGVTAKTDDTMMSGDRHYSTGLSDEFAALLNDAGNVWFIARAQRFDKGGRLKLDTLKEALTEKFGQPSDHSIIGSLGFTWQYDRNGKQWKTGSGVAPCQGNGTSTMIPGVSMTAPRSFSPRCGLLVSVNAVTQKDHMVSYYTISITDVKGMFDELSAQDAKEEADRKQKLADEQAKAVKPKI